MKVSFGVGNLKKDSRGRENSYKKEKFSSKKCCFFVCFYLRKGGQLGDNGRKLEVEVEAVVGEVLYLQGHKIMIHINCPRETRGWLISVWRTS